MNYAVCLNKDCLRYGKVRHVAKRYQPLSDVIGISKTHNGFHVPIDIFCECGVEPNWFYSKEEAAKNALRSYCNEGFKSKTNMSYQLFVELMTQAGRLHAEDTALCAERLKDFAPEPVIVTNG